MTHRIDYKAQVLLNTKKMNFVLDVSKAENLLEYCDFSIDGIKDIYKIQGSDNEIRNYLLQLGWQPTELTKGGTPKLTNDILEELPFDCCVDFLKLRLLKKIKGYIKSWLSYASPQGFIGHRCSATGTVTGRCTHSEPNLAQIPSKKGNAFQQEIGAFCRGLFGVPKGWHMIGADLKGIETRMLGHYLSPIDKRRFSNFACDGDIHLENARQLGVSSRDTAKTFLYALIYGASVSKLSSILKMDEQYTLNRKMLFENKIGMDKLKARLWDTIRKQGYFKALDGRHIKCDQQYKALNYLLQSGGALVAKVWMLRVQRLLENNGLKDDVRLLIFSHDELQYAVRNSVDDDLVEEIILKAAQETGEYFRLYTKIEAEVKRGSTWAETH